MPNLISRQGIQELARQLPFKDDTLKARLFHAIAACYADESSMPALEAIPAEQLITQLWEVDSPKEIQARRKNLSSLKSALNKSLKDLEKQGKNPEAMVVGRDNTFVVSEERKDSLIEKLGITAGDGQSMVDLFSSFKKIIADMAREQGGDDMQALLEQLDETRQLVQKISGRGTPGSQPAEDEGAGPRTGVDTGAGGLAGGEADGGATPAAREAAPEAGEGFSGKGGGDGLAEAESRAKESREADEAKGDGLSAATSSQAGPVGVAGAEDVDVGLVAPGAAGAGSQAGLEGGGPLPGVGPGGAEISQAGGEAAYGTASDSSEKILEDQAFRAAEFVPEEIVEEIEADEVLPAEEIEEIEEIEEELLDSAIAEEAEEIAAIEAGSGGMLPGLDQPAEEMLKDDRVPSLGGQAEGDATLPEADIEEEIGAAEALPTDEIEEIEEEELNEGAAAETAEVEEVEEAGAMPGVMAQASELPDEEILADDGVSASGGAGEIGEGGLAEAAPAFEEIIEEIEAEEVLPAEEIEEIEEEELSESVAPEAAEAVEVEEAGGLPAGMSPGLEMVAGRGVASEDGQAEGLSAEEPAGAAPAGEAGGSAGKSAQAIPGGWPSPGIGPGTLGTGRAGGPVVQGQVSESPEVPAEDQAPLFEEVVEEESEPVEELPADEIEEIEDEALLESDVVEEEVEAAEVLPAAELEEIEAEELIEPPAEVEEAAAGEDARAEEFEEVEILPDDMAAGTEMPVEEILADEGLTAGGQDEALSDEEFEEVEFEDEEVTAAEVEEAEALPDDMASGPETLAEEFPAGAGLSSATQPEEIVSAGYDQDGGASGVGGFEPSPGAGPATAATGLADGHETGHRRTPKMLEVLSQYLEPEEALAEKVDTLAETNEEYVAQLLERFTPKFIHVPAGDYPVGSSHPKPPEQRQRIVHLDSFHIGQFPVTNDLFELFVRDTGYETEAETAGYGLVYLPRCQEKINPVNGRAIFTLSRGTEAVATPGANWRHPAGPGSALENRHHHPVVQVSRNDAMAFATWAGKRLPMEEEWEAAARGKDGRLFPWGNLWVATRGNFASSFAGTTTPVSHYGLEAASPFGLQDMLGNVYEWTASRLDQIVEKVAAHRQRDDVYILKGGAWVSQGMIAACHRMLERGSHWSNIVGFRCVAQG